MSQSTSLSQLQPREALSSLSVGFASRTRITKADSETHETSAFERRRDKNAISKYKNIHSGEDDLHAAYSCTVTLTHWTSDSYLDACRSAPAATSMQKEAPRHSEKPTKEATGYNLTGTWFIESLYISFRMLRDQSVITGLRSGVLLRDAAAMR